MPHIRRRINRVEYEEEYKQVVVDITKEIPDLTKHFKDDWYIAERISCAPVVIVIFCRNVEVNKKNDE